MSKKKRKGYNFKLDSGETINVVTARKAPNYLPVEVGKEDADIYVLAHWDQQSDKTTLIGWATREEMMAAPVGKLVFTERAPENHKLHVDALRDMATLKRKTIPHTVSMF